MSRLVSTLCPYLLIILTLNLCSLSQQQSSNKLKVCVVSSPRTGNFIQNNCKKIDKDHIECVIASDRIECLRVMANGRADFGVFEPEDLYASQAFTEGHFLVTHELRLFQNDSVDYEMVVVVSGQVKSLSDLQGKTFCHPGYDTIDNDWTPVFSNYFQHQIMPKKCDTTQTLLENKISALSEYFKTACIAGVWSSMSDRTIDKTLKLKYGNLCAHCDNPTACYTNDQYHGREGALLCLTSNAGDVAWVRLEDARQHFKEERSESNFQFLCPDGTVRPLRLRNKPCIWLTRPWPVIAARRDAAERVARVIDTLNNPKYPWENFLLQLLEPYRATVVRTDPMKTPEDFLRQFAELSSAYARSTCYPSRTVRWCLPSNLQDRKCQWLREVANSYGLEPAIACLQQAGRNASIQAVAKGSCDMYVAQPEDLMTALEANLTVAVELVASHLKYFNNIGMFVKSSASYKTLEDLKGSSACFTGYRSVGWNGFVAVMSNRTKDKMWKCSDERAMSSFFKSITFPDADKDPIASTYDCLLSGKGDVAIVTVEEKFRDNKHVRRICVEDPGDEDCILTWSTVSSVMISQNIEPVRRREIISLLEEMDTWFGTQYPAPTPAVTLYAPYDSHGNVIFPGVTSYMQQDISFFKLPRPYTGVLVQLMEARNQSIACGSSSVSPRNSIVILLIVAMLSKSCP